MFKRSPLRFTLMTHQWGRQAFCWPIFQNILYSGGYTWLRECKTSEDMMPAMRIKSISIPSRTHVASSIDRKLGSPWLLSCPHVFFKSNARCVHPIHFPSTFHPLQSIHFPLQACHHLDSDPHQLCLLNALHVSDIFPSQPLHLLSRQIYLLKWI